MKKLFFKIILLLVVLSPISSYAFQRYVNGIWYSNVCSNSFSWWEYPWHMAQPVGTSCQLPNGTFGIVGG